jgi:hypothetical protein
VKYYLVEAKIDMKIYTFLWGVIIEPETTKEFDSFKGVETFDRGYWIEWHAEEQLDGSVSIYDNFVMGEALRVDNDKQTITLENEVLTELKENLVRMIALKEKAEGVGGYAEQSIAEGVVRAQKHITGWEQIIKQRGEKP